MLRSSTSRDLDKLDGRWRLMFTNNLGGLGKLSPLTLRDVYQASLRQAISACGCGCGCRCGCDIACVHYSFDTQSRCDPDLSASLVLPAINGLVPRQIPVPPALRTATPPVCRSVHVHSCTWNDHVGSWGRQGRLSVTQRGRDQPVRQLRTRRGLGLSSCPGLSAHVPLLDDSESAELHGKV